MVTRTVLTVLPTHEVSQNIGESSRPLGKISTISQRRYREILVSQALR
jgi:hypothetical protein